MNKCDELAKIVGTNCVDLKSQLASTTASEDTWQLFLGAVMIAVGTIFSYMGTKWATTSPNPSKLQTNTAEILAAIGVVSNAAGVIFVMIGSANTLDSAGHGWVHFIVLGVLAVLLVFMIILLFKGVHSIRVSNATRRNARSNAPDPAVSESRLVSLLAVVVLCACLVPRLSRSKGPGKQA